MSALAFGVRELEPDGDGRYLVVNADDFGMTEGITRGIVRAHERGVVTSASLMVRRPAAAAAAAYARTRPQLGVGLHVDLGEWEYRDGEWSQSYRVVELRDPDAVSVEIERQLEGFRRLMGRDPTHLDSHQHLHREHPADAVVGEVARRLGVPLRHLSPGVRHRGDFFGQSSKGERYPEGITVDALIGLLADLAPGITELGCHPGETADYDGPYRDEREIELKVLCDPRVFEALIRYGVDLRSFSDVGPLLPSDSESWRRACEERGTDSFRKGSSVEAEAWFRRAVAAEPANVGAWLWLSRARAKHEDVPGAFAAVQSAIDLQPGWVSVKLQHADVLAQAGSVDEAVGVLTAVVAQHSDRADLLRRATQRLADLRADAATLPAAEALLALQPQDEDARYARAAALWRMGRGTEASELLGAGTGADGVPRGRAAVRFFLETGDPQAAWTAIQATTDSSIGAPLLLAAGNALRKSGAITAAHDALERAVTRMPDDATARAQLESVAGEAEVLQGSWRPPELAVRRFRPRRGTILHLVGHSAPHSQVGYTVRTHSVTRAQRQAGLEPHVVTRLGYPWDDGFADAGGCDELDGVLYHRLRSAGGTPAHLGHRLAATVHAAAEVVREVRPAVLHAATDYRNALVALTLGKAFRLPVVYEVRGFWEETRLAAQGHGAVERECYVWHRERELECMRHADRVVTLAQVMRAELVERGVPGDAISVVPNAVDVDAFPTPQRDDELATRLGIRAGETVVGYISTFSHYEGIRFLLDAVANLRAGGAPVRCLLVGDGEERAALEAQAAALGLREHVVFTGRVPHAQVLAYYSLIDVFVVPRTADRVSQLVTPLKPYEAMATGRAVVVSRVPALVEMVEEGVTGLGFEPEDPRDLASVVGGLVTDPDRRAALGDAGREWVRSHRSWRENGLRYLELYRSLGAA